LRTVIGKVPPVCTSAAVNCAVSCVALTNVVGRLLPLNRTIELALKLVPLTVNTKSASPASLFVGEILVSVGTGLLTVRLTGFELPPPGSELKTVIGKSPFATTSAAVICAVICVELTRVLGRSLPLKRTTELALKLVPLTVNTKAASPANLVVGEMVVTVGTGLLTARSLELEIPPPGNGLKTVIGNVPVATTSAAVIWAVNFVEFTKVVARSLPLIRTTEPLTKAEPLTVSVNPPAPTIAVEGDRLLMAGTGFRTVNGIVAEVPPPGAGLETAIGKFPAAAVSPASICAVSCVLLTRLVVRLNPLMVTIELLLKLVPVTVSVKTPVPTF